MMVAAGIENAAGFAQWPENEKLAFLNKELETPRPLTHPSMILPKEASEVLAALRAVASHI